MTVHDRPRDVGMRRQAVPPRIGAQLARPLCPSPAMEVPMCSADTETPHPGRRDAVTVEYTKVHADRRRGLGVRRAGRCVTVRERRDGLLELSSRACVAATSLLTGVRWAS